MTAGTECRPRASAAAGNRRRGPHPWTLRPAPPTLRGRRVVPPTVGTYTVGRQRRAAPSLPRGGANTPASCRRRCHLGRRRRRPSQPHRRVNASRPWRGTAAPRRTGGRRKAFGRRKGLALVPDVTSLPGKAPPGEGRVRLRGGGKRKKWQEGGGRKRGGKESQTGEQERGGGRARWLGDDGRRRLSRGGRWRLVHVGGGRDNCPPRPTHPSRRCWHNTPTRSGVARGQVAAPGHTTGWGRGGAPYTPPPLSVGHGARPVCNNAACQLSPPRDVSARQCRRAPW